MMKTILTQQAIKSQYITELHKQGIKEIEGLALEVCDLHVLRKDFALVKAVSQ